MYSYIQTHIQYEKCVAIFNTHHDITDLVKHWMSKNTKT